MAEFKKSLHAYEFKFHNEVFNWIIAKMSHLAGNPPAILDLSLDDCIFSSILAKRMNASKLVSVVRDDNSQVENEVDVRKLNISTNDAVTASLQSLGQFDLVIVRDMLHELENLETFFTAIKCNLNDNSIIFVLTRPKSPPVPLPDPAMEMWRKMAPTREQINAAAEKAGYKTDSYQASCPIKIDKLEWGKILKTRSIAAVKSATKCTDKEINGFIQGSCKGKVIEFEEKLLILLFKLKTADDAVENGASATAAAAE